MRDKTVLILGGDGYLGWPSAMHFAAHGYNVAVVDNYLRRDICRQENVKPLFPVPRLDERTKHWNRWSTGSIRAYIGDLQDWEFTESVFRDFLPEIVVHYAEQPSAPYSMVNRRTASLTLRNNLMGTANVVFAVRKYCRNAHIIKLGTMGEYGTPNIDIEEGWIEIHHKGRKDRFLFPRQAGSLYHTTKIMDTDLLWFYVRTWDLRVTDLMQGPVYGIFTDETGANPDLMSFLNYDEIFGTVINRFVVQAVAGFPLTVYGQGGQTRGYINLIDTLNCVRLAAESPPARGELRILNQVTETFTVNELAEKVKGAARQLGIEVTVRSVENPRIERESHYYNPAYSGFKDLGLDPTFLTNDVLTQFIEFVLRFKGNILERQIVRNVSWK